MRSRERIEADISCKMPYNEEGSYWVNATEEEMRELTLEVLLDIRDQNEKILNIMTNST
jgi:hypothetical protein